MKLMHLSDLHLGKRVNEFSMLEDQEYILNQILKIAEEERPEAVLIAGDIYDKSVPSAEAVQLFDDFLYRLFEGGFPIFLISGNHDSPERLAFGARLLDRTGIHIAPVYAGHVEPVVLSDAFGPVELYLLPFVKPSQVRRFFPDREIASYTDALRTAAEEMLSGREEGKQVRRVLVTHQFVTGAFRSESEEISVGGSDNVDASVFEAFDYVALGHIHGPQNVGSERVRYCGTPLKYSFSETEQQKSVTIAELGPSVREEKKEAGDAPGEGEEDSAEGRASLTVRTVPLKPLRDLCRLRGTYEDLMHRSFDGELDRQSYFHITLTDEEDVLDAAARLRLVYPNLMKLAYDNRRTRAGAVWTEEEAEESKTPLELFAEFYEKQNNQPMSKEQLAFADSLIAKIWRNES